MEWFVRGSALATPARTGGMYAEKGFEFQKAYAVWLLTKLLCSEDKLSMIRYEGAQDVDLFLTNKHQIHVQVKKYDKTPLDLVHAYDIVAGFVRDYQDATTANGVAPADGLRFRLVLVGTVTDLGILDIARRINIRRHAPKVAAHIFGSTKPPASLKDAVRAVLNRVEAEIFPVGSPTDMYRRMAEAGLARFGVIPDRMDDAVRALIVGIRWRRNITARDVAAQLADYLPHSHPASGKSPIRLVTAAEHPPQSAKAFYSSRAQIWPAIFAGADADRDELPRVIDAIKHRAMSKILISGPSGSGKSTLARRAAWDLAKNGEALVLEVSDASEAAGSFEDALRLAKQQGRSGRHTILIIDDLPNYDQLVARVAEHPFDATLKVVATTWRPVSIAEHLGEGVIHIAIGEISEAEAKALAAKLSCQLDQISSRTLEQIRKSGQLLLLNLVLLGEGSAENFADRLLTQLRNDTPDLVDPYLDLCVFGRFDTSIPTSLLLRHNRVASNLIQSREKSGLLFPVGTHRYRSGHRLLSTAVVTASRVEPIERMLNIASSADVSFDEERRFVVGTIVTVASDDQVDAGRACSNMIATLAANISRTGEYLDVRRVSRALAQLGMAREAEEVGRLATKDRIRTGADAAAYRAESGQVDPRHKFEVLLAFYAENETLWGWRNFLRFASNLDDNDLKLRALDQARGRLSQPGLEPTDGKVIADLLTAIIDSPEYANHLLLDILNRFPSDVSVACAVAQCLIARVRSSDVFVALLKYSQSLFTEIDRDKTPLVRQLKRASWRAQPAHRMRWLCTMMKLAESESQREVRGLLLRYSAELAESQHLDAIQDMIGQPTADEHHDAKMARVTIARKRRLLDMQSRADADD